MRINAACMKYNIVLVFMINYNIISYVINCVHFLDVRFTTEKKKTTKNKVPLPDFEVSKGAH